MAHDSNSGTSKLASVLISRMKEESHSPLVLDFGSIEQDGSLKTNTFPVNIPRSDYRICRHLSGQVLSTSGGKHEGHTEGTGEHLHSLSGSVLKAGDRVLVAWVNNDAVVIDVIVSANVL